MAKIKSPKIYDPYLGEMYGNILDQYDNPAYNLRLYLKPESVGGTSSDSATGTTTDTQTTNAGARSDTPSEPKTTTVPDKKIVIVAQTGVTGNQIDNLEIDGVANESGQRNVTFTIVQPGAANLLDQLQYARKYLGASEDELTAQDFKIFLDINFVGYDSDPDNNEEGGEPTQIIDTITYELIVKKVGVRIDNTGSQYNFETAVHQSIGKNDQIYKLPSGIIITGSTITEFFEDLEVKYNSALRSQSTEYAADTVKFDVSALLGKSTAPGQQGITSTGANSKLYIKDEKIPTQANDQRVEGTTAPSYANPRGKTSTEIRSESDGASETGTTDRQLPGVNLTLKTGDSIEKIVASILSMNEEFQQLATRKKDLNDPGNTEVDVEKSFVAWFDIFCQVENVSWDKNRNRYTRRYTYTPYLTQDIRSDIALTTKETEYLQEKGESFGSERPVTALATKRLQDLYNSGALHKSFFYTFTGLNDQIINLDINLDNAIAILMPPKGGMIGDFSVTSRPSLVNSAPENADLTQDDKLKAAKDAQNKESIVGLLKKLKGSVENIKSFADAVGRTVDEVSGIINDVNGASARAFAESLDAATRTSLVKQLGGSEGSDPTDTPTTNTEITVTSFGPYSPEVSGFLYAADFVQPGGNLTTDEIEAAGLTMLDTRTPTNVGAATPQTKSVASPLSGITSTGPSSVLMGYLYRSRTEGTNFLLDIDLTVRGDPYWITNLAQGKFEYGMTTPDQIVEPAPVAYYFLLTIGTPSRYDFNIDDEDKNSGYWSDGRTSGYFSGLYMPRQWKNRFSNGIFTTEIKAVKEIAVPLQWIRRVAPGETPPAWDRYFSQDQYNDFVNQATLTRDTALNTTESSTGSNDPGSPPIPIEDLPALQIGGERNTQAKADAERFLGRTITPREWELTLRAAAGESGGNPDEDAAIVAVILNRARTNYRGYGTGIEDQLTALNQFQAVTGENNSGGNRSFYNPSQQQIGRITNNILNNLGSANRGWDGFVATNPQAYAGTRRGVEGGRRLIANIRAAPGSQDIGGSIFFDSKQLPEGTFD